MLDMLDKVNATDCNLSRFDRQPSASVPTPPASNKTGSIKNIYRPTMQDFPLYGVYNSRNIKNRIENNRNENNEILEKHPRDGRCHALPCLLQQRR